MTLKKSLMVGAAGAALFAFAAPVAIPAEAGSIKNGNATDLTVYGQVNRSMMLYRDGKESGYRHQDGGNGSTRFGFKFKGKMNESVDMGGTFEVQLQSNKPDNMHQAFQDGTTQKKHGGETDSADFAHRKSEIYISHKQFGKLVMGQSSVASDGMSDGLDLGYASTAFAGMDASLFVAGMKFRADNTTAALTKANVRSVFKTFDRGREDLIRYETPKMSGFSSEVDLYDQGEWGVGAKYDNKFGGVQLRVRAFYENLSGGSTTGRVWQLGASVKHDSGVSLTGLYGKAKPDSGKQHTTYGATVGYTANMNSLGATGVGVHFEGTQDVAGDEIDGRAFGVGFNQQIKSAGANIYGNVMLWDVNVPSTTVKLDKLVTFIVGGQIRF